MSTAVARCHAVSAVGICISLVIVAASLSSAAERWATSAPQATPVWGGIQWALAPLVDYSAAIRAKDRTILIEPDTWPDHSNFERFVEGLFGCEVFYNRSPANTEEAAAMAERWPVGTPQPKTFHVGQVRIAVAVNRINPVRQATLDQIRDMLRVDGYGKTWRELAGGGSGAIHPYGERGSSTSRLVIRQACMLVGDEQPGWHYTFRPEFEMLDGTDAVLEKLRTDRHGIGFFLYTGQVLPPHVKLLAVARSANAAPVALETGTVIQDDYPLAEYLVLYLRPDASAAARAFCEFAVSPAGAAIAARHGLTTPTKDAESAVERRLADSKAGRGHKIFASGAPMVRALIPVLASEYVRRHEVIQVAYAATESDTGVVGGFVSDRPNRPELVFLGGRPVGKALEIHGARWNEIEPEGHLLAGRATALIVNAANKIDALTLEELESIWSGEADDWSAIDGTGLTPPDPPLRGTKGPNALPVHRYGLRKSDPAAELFERARPARAKNGRMTFLPSTEEVVASVGVDPYAIGVVDLAAIPKTGQTIKVIGIIRTKNNAGGDGQKPEVIRPTAATIRDGTYPLAERIFLYVHPKASEAAKGFAKFLASESLEQAYHSHGLLPLVNSKKDQVVSPPPSAKPVPTEGWSFP